ncbi:MAG TPA: hypothetical protein VFO41_04095 [Alphaproteobacteria bacterium]|nr:hypothetical protein [Alphaproteobacteria bacterium]
MSTDLDFSRYAPVPRPALVWQCTDAPPPGELTILAGYARGAAALIWRCFVIALIVVWRRICWRAAGFYHYVLHSLPTAWTVAGLGAGFGVAFPIITFLAR